MSQQNVYVVERTVDAFAAGGVETLPALFRPMSPEPRQSDTQKPPGVRGLRDMELGGLEPPTSWVRSRRSPN